MEWLFKEFGFIALFFMLLGLAAFVVQLCYYLRYFSAVIQKNRFESLAKIQFSDLKPAVSVVICARNEADNLKEFLPKVLEQDYPIFEVIVVDDASEDDTELVLNSFQQKYTNLYVTKIPKGVNVVSRKKLAATIGIKATKNDILLFTDADCYPASKDWISLMVRNISNNTNFVIGFGDYIKKNSFINRLITYDTLFIAIQYFGLAYVGLPYMAVGRNLLYKKSVFYDNKGFAGHLHIASGDDDLLINKAGNSTNTAIECSYSSKTMSVPEPTFYKWIRQKQRHLTASALYTKKSKKIIGIEAISRCLFYLSTLMIIFFTKNINLVFVAVSIFLIRYIVQAIIINKTAKILSCRRYFFLISIFDIILPIISSYLILMNIFHKKRGSH